MRTEEDWGIIREGLECPICHSRMFPVWIEEFEYHKGIRTGRRRTGCSHLECDYCGHKEVVDGDFLAEEWH